VIEEEIVEDKVVETKPTTPNADEDWLKGF